MPWLVVLALLLLLLARAAGHAARPRPPFLLVGVKTSVVHNALQRHAIRETWASTLPLDARVVFLGCEPDLSTYTNATERLEINEAIDTEKRVFRDLWTTELACVDSYASLLTKVTCFLRAAATIPTLHYVMIVDDDVYVRVDRVVKMLRHNDTPKTRFYGGFVFSALAPVRQAGHKNQIPRSEYPLSTLPPFAGGPHYILSADLVQLIARNHDRFQGLRALDDVSIAMWLQALLLIRPVHLPSFVLLRTTPCCDDAIAIADLSPASVHQLHQNAIANRPFCTNVTVATAMRHHRSIVLPDESDEVASDTTLTWELLHDAASQSLHVGVTIAVATREVMYEFIPATEVYERGLCARAATLLLSKLYITVGAAFCEFHRRKLREYLDKTMDDDPNVRALLTLTHHNLAANKSSSLVKTVGLSRSATFARILIECLLTKLYPAARIIVQNHDTPDASPDIFVLSDRDHDYARFITKYGQSSQLVMIGTEPQSDQDLDPRVTLITSFGDSVHPKQVYLPVASIVFAESFRHSPLQLLHPRASARHAPRRFCGYVNSRYDALRSEYMYNLLDDVEPVDALGTCQGVQQSPAEIEELLGMDSMVATYSNYKFVLAFEDTIARGYVSGQIVAAFLAGAIPIYYGHSETVNRLFNPHSYIHCADFDSLRACAQRVREVHTSHETYAAMRRAAPVTNQSAFVEAFGWHPAVDTEAGVSGMIGQLNEYLAPNTLALPSSEHKAT